MEIILVRQHRSADGRFADIIDDDQEFPPLNLTQLRFGDSAKRGDFVGSAETVADRVIAILQQRGLFRSDYTGTTFREHLGLAEPVNRHRAAARERSAA